LFPLLIILLDLVCATLAVAATHAVAITRTPHLNTALELTWTDLLTVTPHMPSGAMMAGVWIASLRIAGGYDPRRMSGSARIAAGVFRAGIGVLLFMVAAQFVLHTQTWSRFMMLSYVASSTIIVGFGRLAFFRIQHLIPQTIHARRVAILGVGQRATQLRQRLDEYGHGAYTFVGFISPEQCSEVFVIDPKEVLGDVTSLGSLANTHDLQELIQATPQLNRNENLILATRAEEMGLRLLQMPTNWGIANPRLALTALGDLQLVDLTTLAYPTRAEQMKRVVDLILVIAGGLVLLPWMLVVGLLIRLTDGGPALFTQERSGRGGRKFAMYKFRSMIVRAETLRADLHQHNEADGVLFKIKDDPRVTPIGRILRRWSIDEVPQLLNVLKGDMNLVGPRPLPMTDIDGIETNEELKYWFSQRSKVKPGITGTWQVSGRSRMETGDMVRLDIDYIQNWSFWLDMVLLLRTIPAVLKGRGAH
jgi:exopolysaccharide biosynthesis polyprenyl glycosylphosphotransferase